MHGPHSNLQSSQTHFSGWMSLQCSKPKSQLVKWKSKCKSTISDSSYCCLITAAIAITPAPSSSENPFFIPINFEDKKVYVERKCGRSRICDEGMRDGNNYEVSKVGKKRVAKVEYFYDSGLANIGLIFGYVCILVHHVIIFTGFLYYLN